ncbi:hypothetical protein NIES2111_63610 (plasmid) [Nostoc sp. NIES-2111]|nr:hypothetical protein NIES2111_63610 [Nostoc sp. NIES-2111]
MAKNPIKNLNQARHRWGEITGSPAYVNIVKRYLPDFRDFNSENLLHWRKAIKLFKERYIKPKEQLLLRPLTPARQQWVKTTGLKASAQSVIKVLPECKFPLNTERDWLLVTSIYAKRYPEKVLAQEKEVEVVECDSTVIQPQQLDNEKYDSTKLQPTAKSLPVVKPVTPVAIPSTPKDPVEQRMSDKLAAILGGVREAANPSGRVDVLTKVYVIEVKKACNWKHGIGQALVYQFYYPNKKPVLFLFGKDVDLYRPIAQEHCQRLGVLYRQESFDLIQEFS